MLKKTFTKSSTHTPIKTKSKNITKIIFSKVKKKVGWLLQLSSLEKKKLNWENDFLSETKFKLDEVQTVTAPSSEKVWLHNCMSTIIVFIYVLILTKLGGLDFSRCGLDWEFEFKDD